MAHDRCMGVAKRSARLARVLGQGLGDVVDLLLPCECPGCGQWDVALCEDCESLLRARPGRCESAAPVLAGSASDPAFGVWSVARYAGAVRGIVLAWKGSGGRRVERAVAEAGREAGRLWHSELRAAGLALDGQVAVVPAPSGRRRRASGRLVVRSLASEVARGLEEAVRVDRASRGRVAAYDVLRRSGGRSRQSGLGVSGRAANRRGSMSVAPGLPGGAACLLVDDVITSGATLAECRRALRRAGHDVLGAFTLAATPAPAAAS